MMLKTIQVAGSVVGMLLLGLLFAPQSAQAACQFQQGVGQGNFGWDCSPGGSSGSVRRNNYGAIAISPSTNNNGESFSWGSPSQAEREALRQCAAVGSDRDCKIIARVQNGCMALATGARAGGWGVNTAAGRVAARRGAIDACRNSGNAACAMQVDRCM